MSAHSDIGPSSADRWMNCPGSVRLSAGLPNPTGEAAAQGIVAHDLAYKLVSGKLEDEDLLAMMGKTVVCEGHEVEIDEDMVDGIMLYRDTIAEDVDMLERLRKPAPVQKHFEVKVEFGGGVWGTADAIVFRKGHKLFVYDFKYGRGVVEAEENPQMGIYGVAAMRTIAGEAYDDIELVIVQPRAGHIDGQVRRWSAPKTWLKDFAGKVEAAVIETQKPDAKIVADESWCKWCRAKKNGCPIFGEAVQREASMSFEVVPPTENEVKVKQYSGKLPEVRLMTLEQLARAYGWRDAIESWFSDVADLIRETLEAGGKVPGWKLVDGRANRKYKEGVESQIVAKFAPTYGEEKLYKPPVLLGITAMEKLVGKAKKGGVGPLDEFTERPEGRKAIARDADPRPQALSGASQAFGVIETTALRADDDIFGDAQPENKHLLEDLLGGASPVEPGRKDPMWPV